MKRRVIHASRARGAGHRTLVLSCGHTLVIETLATRRAPAWAECRACIEVQKPSPPPETASE